MRIRELLDELQWKQLQHDEKYHKDIWLLSVQQRLKHMVLHQAKYCAKLFLSTHRENKSDFEKSIIDAFIITVSMANILNLRISDHILSETQCEFSSMDDLAHYLLDKKQSNKPISREDICKEFSISVGTMCKAIESLDHMEAFPFRETLTQEVKSLFTTTMCGIAQSSDQEISSLIEERLVPVEEKSIFFKRLGNYRDGY